MPALPAAKTQLALSVLPVKKSALGELQFIRLCKRVPGDQGATGACCSHLVEGLCFFRELPCIPKYLLHICLRGKENDNMPGLLELEITSPTPLQKRTTSPPHTLKAPSCTVAFLMGNTLYCSETLEQYQKLTAG